ncbi:MAG: hypothetical protein JNL73_19635 [Anaerolineales bacterium]|nr:hypothetical protein [Anaerolineales bacterium]
MIRVASRLFLLFSTLPLLVGCATQDDLPSLDGRLRAIIQSAGLTGDPVRGRTLPTSDDPLPRLGMQLFFTKALSGNGDAACVSCHHPYLGGGDGLPMSIGIDADQPELLGPGRTHPEGPLVPRNAPTTFNAGLWDQVMFHDGRIESLGKTAGANGADGYGIRTPDRPWGYPDVLAGPNLVVAQARFPVTSEEEMRGFDFGNGQGNGSEVRNALTRDLLAQIVSGADPTRSARALNTWLSEFQRAFASDSDAATLITFENIAYAIGEYERSQVLVETPWKAYVEGDVTALSESAKRGALLFFQPPADGGAGCASCHSGDFFTDEQFHVLAIPQIGVGKDSGLSGDDDWGRALETHRDDDRYAFRTPTLLNVAVTGPYGHDGAYATLEGIVRHHLNPEAAVADYAFDQLDPSIRLTNARENTQNALAQWRRLRDLGRPTVAVLDLSDAQVADLLAFLAALTDPCVQDRACLAAWVPGDDIVDPDGMRLQATFSNPP